MLIFLVTVWGRRERVTPGFVSCTDRGDWGEMGGCRGAFLCHDRAASLPAGL